MFLFAKMWPPLLIYKKTIIIIVVVIHQQPRMIMWMWMKNMLLLPHLEFHRISNDDWKEKLMNHEYSFIETYYSLKVTFLCIFFFYTWKFCINIHTVFIYPSSKFFHWVKKKNFNLVNENNPYMVPSMSFPCTMMSF